MSTLVLGLLFAWCVFFIVRLDMVQDSQMNQLASQLGCTWEGHARGLGHTYSWHLVCEEEAQK